MLWALQLSPGAPVAPGSFFWNRVAWGEEPGVFEGDGRGNGGVWNAVPRNPPTLAGSVYREKSIPLLRSWWAEPVHCVSKPARA